MQTPKPIPSTTEQAANRCELTGVTLDAMRRVVARIWADRAQTDLAADAPPGVSWVGFYASPGVSFTTTHGHAPPLTQSAADDQMLLICREPKPACSPIGLHGKCGHAHTTRHAVIVRDVFALAGGTDNQNYVACDPNDRAELVLPCTHKDGTVYTVLDLDSYQPNAFSEADAHAMHALLLEEGLTDTPACPRIDFF